MSLLSLLPEQIQTPTGMVATSEALDGKKAVALYFSAHWCPPCRSFTPVAAEWYLLAKTNPALEVGVSYSTAFCRSVLRLLPVMRNVPHLPHLPPSQIIFVSADEDADGFAAYFATMPWAAIAFEGTADAREALSSKFGVSGIPALIVVNPADCSVIDQNGRATLTANKSDPAACFAKWGC